MLLELSIKNFAIIEDLQISFKDGLTILSGETGAGKSVIINAVNLLLGARANSGLIRAGEETAEIEALFEISPKAADALSAQGYDASNQELLARRIVSKTDRHRIYINGRMATMTLLNSITENLASISGQHAHQGLLKEDEHLLILDQFGALGPLRAQLSTSYHELLPLIDQLNQIKSLEVRQTERMELLKFQKEDISKAEILPGEDVDLENERTVIKNHATLYEAAYNGVEELYSGQGSVAERMASVRQNLEKAAEIDPDLARHARAVEDAALQVEDISEELRGYLTRIAIDENRLEEVDERMDILNRLKRKYGGDLQGVLSHLDSVKKELSSIENLSEHKSEIESAIRSSSRTVVQRCRELSEKRKKAAEILSKKVESELAALKMEQTRFSVSLQSTPAAEESDPWLVADGCLIHETGMDRASFMIAPNPGEDGKPLVNIASGGELSRVVLALKAILAESESVETIVFDEVDAGIGGGVAEVVGKKLLALSRRHQVICITHLPQIAKFGDAHFGISKHVKDGRTTTEINPLNPKERLTEIARMLGGEKITGATLDHAREMLNFQE